MDGNNFLLRLHNLDDLNRLVVNFKYLQEMSLTGN